MKREDVEYYSGGEICRSWFYPASVDRPAPALVFCPGYTGTKFAAFYQPYVERFVSEGLSVLLIDYRGWGESGGPRGVIDPLAQVADVRAGVTFLETRPEVDASALGLFGVSFGGGNATYVAGVDDRIKAAVSVSGIADGRAFLRSMRREYEWSEFLDQLATYRRQLVTTGTSRWVAPMGEIAIPTPERRATTVKGDVPAEMTPEATPLECADAIVDYRPVDLAPRIAPRAMLWFYVAGDVVVPTEHSITMYEAAGGPKKLVELVGASHYSAYVDHLDRISGESVAWFQQWIRADRSRAHLDPTPEGHATPTGGRGT